MLAPGGARQSPLCLSDQARGRNGGGGGEKSGGKCATGDSDVLSKEQAGSLGGLAEAKERDGCTGLAPGRATWGRAGRGLEPELPLQQGGHRVGGGD